MRSLSSHARLIELLDSMKHITFDILGLSELRRVGNSICEYEDFIFQFIGETAGLYGVGFIIKKHLKKYIETIIGLSERVALLTLNINNFKLAIIQVYAPTESADENKIEEFYRTIDKALTLAGNRKTIVMGDFNAKIGSPKPEEHLIMRKYGYGVRNTAGERMVEFAFENKLSIINTFFDKKPKNRWTWRSPDGKTKNELDYILLNFPQNVHNIEVLNVEYSSDHRPVRTKIKFNPPRKSRTRYNKNPKNLLKTEEQISTFSESLHSNIKNLLEEKTKCTVQEYYDKLIKIIETSLSSAQNSITKTKKQSVITDHTRQLISRRHELQNTKPKSRCMKNELKALYKLTNKYIQRDYTTYRSRTIERHLNTTGSLKRAFKDLRTHKHWIEGLQKQNKIHNNREGILNIATTYYKNLYSGATQTLPLHGNPPQVDHAEEIEPIDETEIIEQIKKMKMEKSPGPDRITNEVIKIGHPLLVKPLTILFNMIIENTCTPQQWSESNIILLYKKGDPKDISNYRPISLLPTLYKLFSSIIEKRIGQVLDSKQPIEQAGFRKGYSTTDHIHTLDQVIEKYQELQRPLYIAFIDYQKAFDTISHSAIWQTLLTQNVNQRYINILKHLYEKSHSRVQLEDLGPPIKIERGVRQGDPLSPRLFIAVLETVISKLNWKNLGINIKGKYLSHLRFADDIALLTDSHKDLQYMISTLHKASKEVGLEINLNKTKVMTNSSHKPLKLEDIQLEYVSDYIYLGKQISFNAQNNQQEVDRRVQKTWNKFWSYKEVLKGNFPVELKRKIMNSYLLPSLTYACQTWKFTLKIKNKIKTSQRSMERSMMKINKLQKIPHKIIRKKTDVIDALSYAQKLKWSWAGHVARMTDDRWTIRATLWPGPAGYRKRGRPQTRWADDITRIAGRDWVTVARNRNAWQSLEEAFT